MHMSISLEVGRRRLVRADIGSQMNHQCKVMLNHLSDAPKEAATWFFRFGLLYLPLHSDSQRNLV